MTAHTSCPVQQCELFDICNYTGYPYVTITAYGTGAWNCAAEIEVSSHENATHNPCHAPGVGRTRPGGESVNLALGPIELGLMLMLAIAAGGAFTTWRSRRRTRAVKQ